MYRVALGALLGVAMVLGAACPAPWEQSADASQEDDPLPGLYLRGATIFTATGASPLSGYAVVVRGDEIRAIEPEVGSPDAQLEVIDLDGLTLLPGLIDAHVHVSTPTRDYIAVLSLFLDFGVTTARDVGGPKDELLYVRDLVADGSYEGPRMLVAGPFFTAPGGHPIVDNFAGYPAVIEAATRAPTSASQAREQVRALAADGVDFIKAVLTDCASFGDSCERLDPALLDAIVDEAHLQGLLAAVHTDTPADVTDALTAGADSLEHGVTMGELAPTLAAEIAVSETYWVGTAGAVSGWDGSTLEEAVARLEQLRLADARVAVGSDSGSGGLAWGASYFHELVHLVSAGYTAAEAIEIATRESAAAIGMGDQLGTIEVGKLADLIAVAGNPLADVAAVHDVQVVIKDGVVVRDRR